MYSIKRYTYNKAKKLGVIVKPSTNKTKKIDVFIPLKNSSTKLPVRFKSGAPLARPNSNLRWYKKRGNTQIKIASVGANGMNDYPTYIQKRGLAYAKTRRRLYRMRHERDRHVRGSAGYYADQLLW